MKRLYSFLALLLLLLASCDYADHRIEKGNWEVYYDDPALAPEAGNIAAYLDESDSSATEKSARLSKNNGGYLFEIVVAEDNPKDDYPLMLVVRELSGNVMHGAAMDLAICNQAFKELRRFPFSEIDKIYTRGNLDIFYDPSIPDHIMNRLADNLEENGFVDEQERTLKLDIDRGKRYLLYLIVDEETASDPYYKGVYDGFRKQLETQVFDKAVSICLSDPYFEVFTRIED